MYETERSESPDTLEYNKEKYKVTEEDFDLLQKIVKEEFKKSKMKIFPEEEQEWLRQRALTQPGTGSRPEAPVVADERTSMSKTELKRRKREQKEAEAAAKAKAAKKREIKRGRGALQKEQEAKQSAKDTANVKINQLTSARTETASQRERRLNTERVKLLRKMEKDRKAAEKEEAQRRWQSVAEEAAAASKVGKAQAEAAEAERIKTFNTALGDLRRERQQYKDQEAAEEAEAQRRRQSVAEEAAAASKAGKAQAEAAEAERIKTFKTARGAPPNRAPQPGRKKKKAAKKKATKKKAAKNKAEEKKEADEAMKKVLKKAAEKATAAEAMAEQEIKDEISRAQKRLKEEGWEPPGRIGRDTTTEAEQEQLEVEAAAKVDVAEGAPNTTVGKFSEEDVTVMMGELIDEVEPDDFKSILSKYSVDGYVNADKLEIFRRDLVRAKTRNDLIGSKEQVTKKQALEAAPLDITGDFFDDKWEESEPKQIKDETTTEPGAMVEVIDSEQFSNLMKVLKVKSGLKKKKASDSLEETQESTADEQAVTEAIEEGELGDDAEQLAAEAETKDKQAGNVGTGGKLNLGGEGLSGTDALRAKLLTAEALLGDLRADAYGKINSSGGGSTHRKKAKNRKKNLKNKRRYIKKTRKASKS